LLMLALDLVRTTAEAQSLFQLLKFAGKFA
jgi:hypothetical protein